MATRAKDCFAYKRNSCTALKVRQCDGCGFYKSKNQHQLDKQLAMERILSLDQGLQEHINETYYGGRMGEDADER